MNIAQLQAYANQRGLNLGQAEKDYYQNLLLFALYQHVGKELVFKGWHRPVQMLWPQPVFRGFGF